MCSTRAACHSEATLATQRLIHILQLRRGVGALPGGVGMVVGCWQHSTQASLPRQFFAAGGLVKRTNSSFPRALLLAAELHGATGPSCDPNVRCSHPPRAPASSSCRNAPRCRMLTQMQAMTIYDLAHPAVNSTAPCWQGKRILRISHKSHPHAR